MSQTNNITASQKLRRACAGVMAAGLLSAGINAQAAPLNLDFPVSPDLYSSGINVAYTAASDAFSAIGTSSTYEHDGVAPAEVINPSGVFDITATIDSSGSLVSGNITITGAIPTLGIADGTLLSGNLTQFGFIDAGGDPLEFIFNVTGGSLAADFGPVGGVILNQSGFTGSFSQDFSNGPFAGSADTSVVPVPAAVWLFGSGLLGLAGAARRRSRN